jgi:hypothetical protein
VPRGTAKVFRLAASKKKADGCFSRSLPGDLTSTYLAERHDMSESWPAADVGDRLLPAQPAYNWISNATVSLCGHHFTDTSHTHIYTSRSSYPHQLSLVQVHTTHLTELSFSGTMDQSLAKGRKLYATRVVPTKSVDHIQHRTCHKPHLKATSPHPLLIPFTKSWLLAAPPPCTPTAGVVAVRSRRRNAPAWSAAEPPALLNDQPVHRTAPAACPWVAQCNSLSLPHDASASMVMLSSAAGAAGVRLQLLPPMAARFD